MKYLLSEEEYNELLNGIKKERKEIQESFQELCRLVASHKPIKFWGRTESEPWGCILNERLNPEDNDSAIDEHGNELHSMGYCDDCPVQDVCPWEWKRWSK